MAAGALGEIVGGKYELCRVLGEGGMGIVYEAIHVRLRQRVAIKMVKPAATTKEFMARFEREARAAAQIGGPHVAKVLDVDALADGTPFIVMELLEGRDLGLRLLERGLLSIADAVDFVQQAAFGLEQAHAAGIVHRDIKPGNLFLCDLHGTDRKLVKLLDFGISKIEEEAKDAPLTETFATFGTAFYMSPEQMRSAKGVDARSDVWSLGIILFQLLVGRPPFTGSGTAVASAVAADPVPRPRDLRADVPEELEAVVLKALEKDPARRYQTARELADALAAFAPAKPIAKVLASIPPPPSTRGAPLTSFAVTPPTGPRAPAGSIADDTTHAAPAPLRKKPLVVAIAVAAVVAVATACGLTIAMGAFRAPARGPVAPPTLAVAAEPPASAATTTSTDSTSPPPAPSADSPSPSTAPRVPVASATSRPPQVSTAQPALPPAPPATTASRTPLHI